LGWEKQKEEEAKEKAGRKQEENEKMQKQKKAKTMEVKRIAEEWEIWDEKEETAKLEAEAKKLVPEKFHKWIKSLARNSWNECPQGKSGIMPLIQEKGLCQGK